MEIEYNVICPNLEAATRIKSLGRVTEIYNRLDFDLEIEGELVDDFDLLCEELKVEVKYLR